MESESVSVLGITTYISWDWSLETKSMSCSVWLLLPLLLDFVLNLQASKWTGKRKRSYSFGFFIMARWSCLFGLVFEIDVIKVVTLQVQFVSDECILSLRVAFNKTKLIAAFVDFEVEDELKLCLIVKKEYLFEEERKGFTLESFDSYPLIYVHHLNE